MWKFHHPNFFWIEHQNSPFAWTNHLLAWYPLHFLDQFQLPLHHHRLHHHFMLLDPANSYSQLTYYDFHFSMVNNDHLHPHLLRVYLLHLEHLLSCKLRWSWFFLLSQNFRCRCLTFYLVVDLSWRDLKDYLTRLRLLLLSSRFHHLLHHQSLDHEFDLLNVNRITFLCRLIHYGTVYCHDLENYYGHYQICHRNRYPCYLHSTSDQDYLKTHLLILYLNHQFSCYRKYHHPTFFHH